MESLLGAGHPALGIYGSWLGASRLATGDIDGAILAYARGIAVDDARSDESSVYDRGMGRLGLGTSYLAARRPDDALHTLDDAAALLVAGSDAHNPAVLRSHSLRALALARLGRWSIAEPAFVALENAPWQPDDRAANAGRFAVLRRLQGRNDEAVALARVCADRLVLHPMAWVRAEAHSGLGLALEGAGRAREAVPQLISARDEFRKIQLQMTPDQADVLLALGRAQATLGQGQAAAESLTMGESFWREYAARPPMAAPSVRDVSDAPGNK